MRIDQARQLYATAGQRKSKGSASGGAFQLPQIAAASSNAATTPIIATGGLDALLALQAVDQREDHRKTAFRWGSELLDSLDALKLSVLEGRSPAAVIQQLRGALARNHADLSDDPELRDLIDAIDLRAQVELAKRGL